jgi:hypothetical protein
MHVSQGRTVRGVTGGGAGSEVGKGTLHLAIDTRLQRQRLQGEQDYPGLSYIQSVHSSLLRILALVAPNRCKLSHKVSFMY